MSAVVEGDRPSRSVGARGRDATLDVSGGGGDEAEGPSREIAKQKASLRIAGDAGWRVRIGPVSGRLSVTIASPIGDPSLASMTLPAITPVPVTGAACPGPPPARP